MVEYWVNRVLERMEGADRLPKPSHHEIHAPGSVPGTRVCIEKIEHAKGVRLGPSLVLLQAWQSLELDRVLEEQDFSREQIATAKACVLNRLIEPTSEHDLPNWIETTALGD